MFKLFCVSHLPPLIGKKNFKGYDYVLEHILRDLKACEEAGATGLLLENENDQPYTLEAQPECISIMTKLGLELKAHSKSLKLGVEFLIHDPFASLAVAKNCDFSFIRSDYFVDKMERVEYGGEIKVNPAEILDYRNKIQANDIEIYADIQVKYATLLEKNKKLLTSAQQAYESKAKGVILSGAKTGEPPTLEEVKRVSKGNLPLDIFIGSGLSPENAHIYKNYIDGAIVGTSLMKDGVLQTDRIAQLVQVMS